MEGEDQTIVRAAWLYYMEGLTQDRVASRLGITRLRVNRLLAEARSSGLVGITINSRLAGCLALEDRLRRATGLRDAVVLPTPEDAALLPALLGRAAGEYVSRHLDSHKVKGIGVGWGATLREAIRFVKPATFPHISVSSLMGGLTRGLEINTFETASALAARLGARCNYLAAPLYAGSPKSRDTLVSQDVFTDAFRQMAATDVALLSVGDLSDRSLLIRYGLPKDVKPASLRRAGAVGDILGQFLDAAGKPIDHSINQRAISPSLAVLAKIDTVIVASGGLNKAHILAAVLRAKLAAVLVTDEATAARALAIATTGRGSPPKSPR